MNAHENGEDAAAIDSFAAQIDAAHNRLGELIDRVGTAAPEWKAVAAEAISEVTVALEEMSVAWEELRAQGDELVAERHNVEAERRRYQDLFDFAPDAYFVTDDQGVIIEANAAAAAILGLEIRTLRGKSLSEFVRGDEHHSFYTHVRRAREGASTTWSMHLVPHIADSIRVTAHIAPSTESDTDARELRWLVSDQRERYRAAEVAGREARLRLLTSALPIGIQLAETDGTTLFVNDRLREIAGRNDVEMLGGHTLDFIHPEDRSRARALWTEVAEGASPVTARFRVSRPDGSVRWVEAGLAPVEHDGGVDGVVCSFDDVTDSVAVEATARTTAAGLEGILQAAADPIVAIDAAQRIVLYNRAAEYAFGWRREDAVGRPLSMLIPAESRAEHDGFIEEFGAEDGPWRRMSQRPVIWITRRDGERFPAEITISKTAFDDGALFTAIVHDVSDRLAAEEAIRSASEQFRGAFEHSPVGLAIAGFDAVLTDANPKLHEILGYPDRELVGADFRDLTHDEDREVEEPLFDDLQAGTRERYETEKRLLTKTGEVVWVHVFATAVEDASGKPAYALALVQDITDRKELEAQLVHTQKMDAIGLFAGELAHEFGNVLTVVRGQTELLESDVHDSNARMRIGEIAAGVGLAQRLVDDLLSFGRRQFLEPRPIEIGAWMNQFAPLLHALLEKAINLDIATSSEALWIRADPNRLEQVLVNLALNARDAMPDGGLLEIAARPARAHDLTGLVTRTVPADEFAVLSITDTGVGMDEQTRARAFEPFFTTRPRGEGTGLGLAIIDGIISQSDGYIAVDSEPGRGTTFRIALPTIPEPPEPAPTTPARAEPTRPGKQANRRVLVVDDDSRARKVICETLQSESLDVIEAGSATEAIAAAAQEGEHIDLLVTDVMMPGIAGPELATQLVHLQPDMRVLFVSGHVDGRQRVEDVLRQHRAFLAKPFGPHELVTTVREMLGTE